jgi:small subunit ribosomal protein S18
MIMRRRNKRDEYKRDPELLKGVDKIDYKDAELLKKFMTSRGKILSRRLLGTNAQQQRQIKRAIRRARVVGLIR